MLLCIFVTAMLLPLGGIAMAQGSVSFELFIGTGANIRTPLSIQQKNHPEIELTARYETRPFEDPTYYAMRFSRGDRTGAWELQFIHHKLHLANPPQEIQHFEITHGFNLLSLNRSFSLRHVTLRFGMGIVLAHTESTVRELKHSGSGGIFGTGYLLTGPALLGGLGKRIPLSRRFHMACEAQLTAARAKVPVADGTASAPNVAVHALLGISYRI